MTWAPYDFPAYCLKSVLRPWPREWEPKLSPGDSLIWGDRAEHPGKSRWLEFAGCSVRDEIAAQKEKNQRSAEISLQVFSKVLLLCVWVWGNYQSQGKKTSVRIRRNRAWHSHWAGNSAWSHQLDWKISIHVTLGEILRKILLTGGK